MNFIKFLKSNLRFAATLICNIALVMLLFTLCRVMFYLCNSKLFADMTFDHFVDLCVGGLQFDLTAVLYTNSLYLLLMLFPLQIRDMSAYQTVAKWVFYVTNSIALIFNCVDIVFFPFSARRITLSTFVEFSNETNILKIIGMAIFQYWYVSLFTIGVIVALVMLFRRSKREAVRVRALWPCVGYYSSHFVIFALCAFLTVIGIRGGLGTFIRPISVGNANKYVNKPNEAFIVLNTPFCFYRTLEVKPFRNPHYFSSDTALNAVFTPEVHPHPNGEFKPLNVVVFILESFSKEYSGEFNRHLDGGAYRGHTPFLDSLIRESLTFEYSFANGHRSIEAMPSVLSSIPPFFEPYVLTAYSSNKVSGIAGELGKKGYYSAFFHGAPNGSMGFDAFANISGYKDYFGLNEYGNTKDFDGTWAIWDEDFFQFFAQKMNTFKQPFTTALFSASSHSPFRVPDRYASRFIDHEGWLPIHKCVEYSDFALRRFFETASKMPWFANTLFVITADHTNGMTHREYLNDAGGYKIPILFYYPAGNLHGRRKEIAQQVDIMPTVLGYLNYDRPYFAFGRNLLDSTVLHCAMMYQKPTFQYFEGEYLYQFDEQNFTAIYDYVNDVELKHNLIKQKSVPLTVEQQVKARIQQYVERMIENKLTVEE